MLQLRLGVCLDVMQNYPGSEDLLNLRFCTSWLYAYISMTLVHSGALELVPRRCARVYGLSREARAVLAERVLGLHYYSFC